MKYKVLKSVAHNVGHSFVSLMNWRGEDYVMSHLTRAALASGVEEARVDLFSGAAEPAAALPGPVRDSAARYAQWFPQLLRSHNVAPGAVVSARLCVRLDLGARADDLRFARHVSVPFECVVELTDDRGKVHLGRVVDSWLASLDFPPPGFTSW